MKIINREQFLKMPPGTLYMEYQPCIFDHLKMKDESLKNDWFYYSLAQSVESNDTGEMADILEKAEKEGASYNLELDVVTRDGCFNDKQLFAVFEKHDVEQLIAKLNAALDVF